MEFRIEYARGVHDDVQIIYDHIKRRAPQAALEWQEKLYQKMLSLQLMPARCSIAPEDRELQSQIRHTFHGEYRIIFTIKDDAVFILAVRHGKRLPLTKPALQDRLARPQDRA